MTAEFTLVYMTKVQIWQKDPPPLLCKFSVRPCAKILVLLSPKISNSISLKLNHFVSGTSAHLAWICLDYMTHMKQLHALLCFVLRRVAYLVYNQFTELLNKFWCLQIALSASFPRSSYIEPNCRQVSLFKAI